MLLEHVAQLHFLLGQLGVEEAFLFPNLLILQPLLLYLSRRQHLLFMEVGPVYGSNAMALGGPQPMRLSTSDYHFDFEGTRTS